MTTRFVAIGVAPTLRGRLDAVVAPVRGRRSELGWTDPLGWHVTLAFLGRLPDTAVPRIVEAVAAAVAEVAARGSGERGGLPLLTIGRAASFGARVLVVEVADEPAGRVAALGARVQRHLAEVGFNVDERAVRAHLTLARARRGTAVDPPLVVETQRALDTLPDVLAWQPQGIGVFSSHPRSNGPVRYVVDAEIAVASRA